VGDEIPISKGTPADYALLQELRTAIFSEFPHGFSATVAQNLDGHQDVCALIAHADSKPVGLNIGYRLNPAVYHITLAGVLRGYRSRGIMTLLHERQFAHARSHGYRRIAFNTFNHFPQMLRFGLRNGYTPKGMSRKPEGALSLGFERELTLAAAPRIQKLSALPVHVESVSRNYHGLIADLCTRTLQEVTEEDVDRGFPEPDRVALIAFVDREPAGFAIGTSRDTRREGFQWSWAGVLPEYRSRGVVTALAGHLVQTAGALGYKSIRFNTSPENTAMLLMGVRLGFAICGMIHIDRPPHTEMILRRMLP
jgi:GNAT superfamily N-acetyltransferase